MNKRTFYAILIVGLIVASYSIWSYMNHREYLSKTAHDIGRWAVIKDSKNDIIAVQTTQAEVWDQLVALHSSKEERWIGGLVEEYTNAWGFRFHPDTIIIATVTIEGAQSNIQWISGDLNYWINTWANVAYVMASVVEIHE